MSWLDHFSERHAPVVEDVRDGLHRVERLFGQQLQSELECVRDLCARVDRYRGKMLRPTMVLLSGLAADGEDGPGLTHELVTLAAVTEMIHVATLVHDDVLDEASVRRQRPTISKLRGNEAAVILGDYLISSAFHLCSSLESQRVALRIGEITTRVCEGELLQLHHRHDRLLDEQTYFEIIDRKTASLIGAACELGAGFVVSDVAVQRRFYQFGVKIGAAFQIQDDLLDLLGEERVVGKSLGKDLEKGKLTLPLIHHLSNADEARRAESLDLLACVWRVGAGQAGGGAATVAEATDARAEVRAALEATGSIDHAANVAGRLVEDAKGSLGAVPDSPARRLMLELADAVLTRDR